MDDEIYCFRDTESKGEYFSLDLSIWWRVDHTISDKNRIRIGGQYYQKDIRVFINKKGFGKIEKLGNFVMFSRKDFSELRKTKGREKGLPLEVQDNGAVWVSEKFADKNLIVFTRRD
jgi:hypothetical protein